MQKPDYSSAASLFINTDIVAAFLSYHIGAAAGDDLLQFLHDFESDIPIAAIPEIFKTFGLTAMIGFSADIDELLLPACIALDDGKFSILLRRDDNVLIFLDAVAPGQERGIDALELKRHSCELVISTQEEFSIFAHG